MRRLTQLGPDADRDAHIASADLIDELGSTSPERTKLERAPTGRVQLGTNVAAHRAWTLASGPVATADQAWRLAEHEPYGRREAPPMHLIARLASLFEPLPPLGRGIAAVLMVLAGMVGFVAGVRRMLAP